MSRRPKTTARDRLIAALGKAQADEAPLEMAFTALVGVLRFLDEDSEMIGKGLDRPLRMLANALVDVRNGAKPALFKRPRAPGRPKDQASQVVVGALADCIDRLMIAGRPRWEAARFVAAEANRLKITIRGKGITAQGVARARDEMNGGRASRLAQQTYSAQLETTPQRATGDPTAREAAEGIVRDVLRAVRDMGF